MEKRFGDNGHPFSYLKEEENTGGGDDKEEEEYPGMGKGGFLTVDGEPVIIKEGPLKLGQLVISSSYKRSTFDFAEWRSKYTYISFKKI